MPWAHFHRVGLLILAQKSLNPAKPRCGVLLTVEGQPAKDGPMSLVGSRRPGWDLAPGSLKAWPGSHFP